MPIVRKPRRKQITADRLLRVEKELKFLRAGLHTLILNWGITDRKMAAIMTELEAGEMARSSKLNSAAAQFIKEGQDLRSQLLTVNDNMHALYQSLLNLKERA